MTRRNYDKLPIEQFGHQLIVSGDLDPVYIALHRSSFEFETLAKWLVSYWCLYHCGVASYMAGLPDVLFWEELTSAAINQVPAPTGGRWPRASERRHWRGQQAVRSVKDLRARGTPADIVCSLMRGPMDFASVANRVKEMRGFGDWIAFKVADMIDRVLEQKVDFDEAAVFMFKDPAKAAIMVWHQRHPGGDLGVSAEQPNPYVLKVVASLTEAFRDLKAPPLYDRPIGLQEVETVLCKWKSHMHGHYALFNDTDEINEGMVKWLPFIDEAVVFAKNMVSRDPRR